VSKRYRARHGGGMKICVTGANGFIGKKLVQLLSQQGHEVTIISRRENNLFLSKVKLIKGDLLSLDCPLAQFLDDCDIIYNCAGEIHNTEVMEALHVESTQRLIQAVLNQSELKSKIIHWVQLSSVGVYGPVQGKANEERIVTEETSVHPKGTYECTKAQADNLVIQAGNNRFFSYTIIRPSNVFGEDMPNGTLRSIAKMVQRGMFFYIGYLNTMATYVHVDDVVDLLIHCMADPRAKGEIFNISNDCLLEKMIGGIADTLNVNRPWIRFPETLVRIIVKLVKGAPLTQDKINVLVARTHYSTLKLEKKLGFSPKLYVPKVIRGTVA
jgi:nucleoside-diphosphate-sugar epimerase